MGNNSEPISTIVHNLASGIWVKVLEADLKQNDIKTIGQLAMMDPNQVKALKGVKPDKVATVKQVLKSYSLKSKSADEPIPIRMRARAPVEEETSQEEEEEIKAALFSRPSPSPTNLEEIDEVNKGEGNGAMLNEGTAESISTIKEDRSVENDGNKFDSEREVSEEIILGHTSAEKYEEVSTSTFTNMSSVTSMIEQPQP